MICPQCGKEFADDTLRCPHCGAGAKPVDAGEPEKALSECSTDAAGSSEPCCCSAAGEKAVCKKRRPGNRLKIAIALLLILAGVVAVGYFKFSRSPELEEMIPGSCPMFVSSDASWWWEAAEDVRVLPEVQNGLKEIEKEFGLTFEKDLTPWMGQMAFAVIEAKQTNPRFAVIAEIRDNEAFKRCLDKLSARAERDTGMKWKKVEYEGVKMRQLDISGRVSPVTVAIIRGYAVCGIGPDSVQAVVDAWKGRKPSIKNDPVWARAFNALPEDAVVRVAYNTEAVMKNVSEADPTGSIRIPESAKSLIVCAFTEGDGSLRMDTVSVAKSEEAKKALREAKDKMGGIDGRSVKQLPDGTFAVMVTSNPGYMVDNLRKGLLDMVNNPQVRMMIEKNLAQVQPVFDALHRCTGECAAAFTYRNGDGFGAVVVSETKDKVSSKASVKDLTSFIAGNGVKISQNAGLATFTDAKVDKTNVHVLPCLGVRDKWLVFGTHPTWITSTVKTDLKLPSNIKDVQFAGAGNFKFIPSVIKWAEQEAKGDISSNKVIGFIRQLKLENATWTAWAKIDPEQGIGQSVMVLQGWDWRQGLKSAMSFIQKDQKKGIGGSVIN
ncbi:MAG: DUF3352 domain-containing protein [Armatimonadota bacterium]